MTRSAISAPVALSGAVQSQDASNTGAGLHPEFSRLLFGFAASQRLAIRLSNLDYNPMAKCPSYGCDAVLGMNAGLIDGDRYCADCIAAEEWEAGRAERLQDAELRSRGIF